MRYDDQFKMSAPLRYTLCTIGGKWKPSILWQLSSSDPAPVRYGCLKRGITLNVSHKVFTEQLRELENDGLITHTNMNGQSLHTEYYLTEKGRFIIPFIHYMRDYGFLFGNVRTALPLESTKGRWEGKSIIYEHVCPTNPELSLHITFNIGIDKETAASDSSLLDFHHLINASEPDKATSSDESDHE